MVEVVKLVDITRSSAKEPPGTARADRSPMDPRGLGFTGRVANWSARHCWMVVSALVRIRYVDFGDSGKGAENV